MRNRNIVVFIIFCLAFTSIVQAVPVEGEAPVNDSVLNKFFTKYDVQDKFKAEISTLLTEGYSKGDVMTAYTFLNDKYGTLDNLKAFLKSKKAGNTWEKIFNEYNSSSKAFKPRSFDFEKLNSMMKNSAITMDDIMIADRISFASGKDFDYILYRKIEGESFRAVNEELKILTSQQKLPIIKITNDQTKYYMDKKKLNQDQVIKAFVLADKFNKKPESIMDYIKSGYSEAKIYATVYADMYY